MTKNSAIIYCQAAAYVTETVCAWPLARNGVGLMKIAYAQTCTAVDNSRFACAAEQDYTCCHFFRAATASDLDEASAI